jgi:phage tail-like protein
MAQSGDRNDPIPGFRFEMRRDDLPVAGFSECTGLQVEIDVKEYNEGGLNSFVRKFPGRNKQGNLMLKRGIVDRELWNWYYDLTQGRVRFRDGTITVNDPSGQEAVMVWRITRAFPLKWTGPELNASQNNVAVETLELAFHALERTT